MNKVTDTSALIKRFGLFLPEWTIRENKALTAEETLLGEDLLMALGSLYVDLLLSEHPSKTFSLAVVEKTDPLFAPLMLELLAEIPLSALTTNENDRQIVLDNLYEFLYTKFVLIPKEAAGEL